MTAERPGKPSTFGKPRPPRLKPSLLRAGGPGTVSEFGKLGEHMLTARVRRGLTQRQLAEAVGLTQSAISRIEQGLRWPTLPQLTQFARALNVSVQWFMSGSNWPSLELQDIALELQDLGVADLLVEGARVPGAFRPPEQVIALAVSGNEPEPRLVEAMPAVLAWGRWNVRLLRAYCATCDERAIGRIAWLADVALTIDRNQGLPGGCLARKELARLLRSTKPSQTPDSLGRTCDGGERLPPVSKRWNTTYPASLAVFRKRAEHLKTLIEMRSRRSFAAGPDANGGKGAGAVWERQ